MKEELKIYISGHCKEYHEDGSHHELSMVPIGEAMEIITDEKITSGGICDQTVIDMRDCIIKLLADKQ